MLAERWEHGSDFEYTSEWGTPDYPWSERPASLWNSGRAAAAAAFEWGRTHLGWRRLHVPSYYCLDVLPALTSAGATLVFYEDDPLWRAARFDVGTLRPGDAVLLCNPFGLRQGSPLPPEVDVLEDHSHDPGGHWARTSTARFAFASARKYLPVPDGGVLWSPRGDAVPLPAPVSDAHAATALRRLDAMLLKARYLAGAPVLKERFRASAVEGERGFVASGPCAAIDLTGPLLASLPTARWRAQRRANFDLLARSARLPAGVRWLEAPRETVPFAAVLQFESSSKRDSVRAALRAERVYAAVLWPIAPGETTSLAAIRSGELLCLHCDHRYGPSDLARVATTLERVLAACASI